jgi:hypothetical protein
MNSAALRQAAIANSTTPRTALRLMEGQGERDGVDLYEQIYTEGKLCMHREEIDQALQCFGLCPPGYRNTCKYSNQCMVYKRCCRKGLVRQTVDAELRASLATILHIDERSSVVCGYAHQLHSDGFLPQHLEDVLQSDAVRECCSPTPGHAALLLGYATERSPWHSNILRSVGKCLERSGDYVKLLHRSKEEGGCNQEEDTHGD